MEDRGLFQLGMDLSAGATQTEESIIASAAHEAAEKKDHFIRRNGKVYAGTHLIIEVVDGEGLDDEERIRQAFLDSIRASGATLLHIHTHKFTPQGVSGVAVLAESHISVHTWPEVGYGAFDVFMCGDADPWQAVPIIKKAFNAREVRVTEILRGEGIVG